MPFDTAPDPITITQASPHKQKFFSFGKSPASVPLSSPSSSSSSSSMNTFFSNVCKVPRTLKNMLIRASSPNPASDTKHKPKKRTKLKPIDLFQPLSLTTSEEDNAAYGYVVANSQQKHKKYSTNVDTKQYRLPTSADRKKSKVSAATESHATNNNLESISQAITPTTGTELPKSEITNTTTATTLGSNDISNENVSPATTAEGPAPITRNKHSSYYDELLAENDIDNLSISSSSDSESDDEEERLTPGDRRWKRQHKAWLKPHPDTATPPRPSVVKHMSEAERIAVYKYLVVNNRRLREPLSLADTLVVLRSGWVASGQCPVFAVTAGTI
ncbi:hypothetical protein D0Z00_004231 [Geotrichum galactomycetum]|uniref:Uncharacterized protein n=1 Tax=Geotrichum galactomycetum TaxID=27317 RepID=A0ACB6UYZ8_9ASCO|nr:hypothetical protein D0Z00_004231 [Geotrichum candidum]